MKRDEENYFIATGLPISDVRFITYGREKQGIKAGTDIERPLLNSNFEISFKHRYQRFGCQDPSNHNYHNFFFVIPSLFPFNPGTIFSLHSGQSLSLPRVAHAFSSNNYSYFYPSEFSLGISALLPSLLYQRSNLIDVFIFDFQSASVPSAIRLDVYHQVQRTYEGIGSTPAYPFLFLSSRYCISSLHLPYSYKDFSWTRRGHAVTLPLTFSLKGNLQIRLSR